MIENHGKKKTREILLEQLEDLNQKMRLATNIYHAIDIEHDMLDIKSMLRWLKDV
tara:strand:+ start:1055 stop:1219 length:165 start_codon:yes stop_codon:yes gene_type:complete